MTRTFKHQIKRIVEYEGKRRTYNTEIATEVAGLADMALFKTRTHGYYFLASYQPEWGFQGVRPVTLKEAAAWLHEHFPTPHEPLQEGHPVGTPKPEIRATLRYPSDLKLQIETAAKNSHLSVNAWVVRCLEDKVSQEEAGE